MTAATDRLPRLLALLPYLLARPGIALADAARDFDVPEAQLRREVRQLRLERDILSKAAAGFARESGTLPSSSSGS